MPRPNTAADLERTAEQEIEEIVDALIRKAQEKAAAVARLKTGSMQDNGLSETASAIAIPERLNQYELISVKALVAYLAHTQKLKPENLRSLLETKFDASGIAAIKRRDFHRVVEYMVNLEDSGTVH